MRAAVRDGQWQSRHVSGYLRFLFRPDRLLTPARALSGERNPAVGQAVCSPPTCW
jgi:hypothetical protein